MWHINFIIIIFAIPVSHGMINITTPSLQHALDHSSPEHVPEPQ